MMTHTYTLSGMTCEGCAATVKSLLKKVDGVSEVRISLLKNKAEISMEERLDTTLFKNALKHYPRYTISEITEISNSGEKQESWFQTYKPVLLIFTYITGVTLLTQSAASGFSFVQWMNHFMAGFFITFSFFKLLNLKGFAESYSTYDIIARRWKNYGYFYALLELSLGLWYLTGLFAVAVNIITILVMSTSLIGVLQSVLNKRKIRCACLGDVFNLPMSTVTILEDVLMILMSGVMLIYLI